MNYIKTDTVEFLILLLKRGFAYFDALSQYPSLQSLPEEERERVLVEEKLGGTKLNIAGVGSPLRAKSPSVKVGICKMPFYMYLHAVMLWWYVVWIRMRSSFFLLCHRNGVVTLNWINGHMGFRKRSEMVRRKQGFLKHRRLQRKCGSRVL